ncbi:ATP-grasp domain-containing protein [Paenibacillus hodogayensis]|uniref:ATP-grasp domain-containing protein n=1 Tax=Paenibacillus hodogayensis TaxID=279208 RepID=A0ABV5W2I5_9BACL
MIIEAAEGSALPLAGRTVGLKVLLTGGRAPVALELARLLAAAGCEVHVAESLHYHLCRVSKAVTRSHAVPSPAADAEGFVAALERIVRREQIDWLIPTCEELFYVASGLPRLSQVCRVLAAPIEQLVRLHSKHAFIRRVEELGFPVPRTRLLASPSEWRQLTHLWTASGSGAEKAADLWPEGCVLKPEFSRSGSKVRFVGRPSAAGRARKAGGPPGQRTERTHTGLPVLDEDRYPWVAQQYIAGRGLCTYSIVHEGKLTAYAAYAVEYSLPSGACVYFESLNHPALKHWVERFAALEKFTGQLAFDFIETAGGELYPIECNPRATSGIHLFGSQDGLAAALLDPQSLGDTIAEPHPGARRMLALPMLAASRKGSATAGGLGAWLRKFATANDAVYRRDDPRPFWEQLLLLNELRRIAARSGRTLLEASTCDIEWNGGTR